MFYAHLLIDDPGACRPLRLPSLGLSQADRGDPVPASRRMRPNRNSSSPRSSHNIQAHTCLQFFRPRGSPRPPPSRSIQRAGISHHHQDRLLLPPPSVAQSHRPAMPSAARGTFLLASRVKSSSICTSWPIRSLARRCRCCWRAARLGAFSSMQPQRVTWMADPSSPISVPPPASVRSAPLQVLPPHPAPTPGGEISRLGPLDRRAALDASCFRPLLTMPFPYRFTCR